MAEAGMDMTNMAMGGAQAPGDEQLLVKFLNVSMENKAKTLAEGRPIFEDVLHVDMKQPGNKGWHVQKPATDEHKQRFAPHYAAWMARNDNAEKAVGTPLDEWPAITRSLADELKYFNIFTVEQLATVSDANMGNVRGLVTLKQKAEKYLDASKDSAAAAQLAEAENRIDELEAMVKELMANSGSEAPKPKRKRRTQSEMAAARAEKTE